mmetsp:Transcript_27503/g.46307  ORF Transcript_27503/g.46307 Transcript_27503/m.46307 type:complete len:114 (+) Transcript_27503:440-781(+)
MLGELFYGKRKQSEWKDKPVRACEVLKKCDVAYVLLPVVLIQLFLLHLEFNGGLQTGGFKKNLCSDQPCTQRTPKIMHQTCDGNAHEQGARPPFGASRGALRAQSCPNPRVGA